MYTHIGIYVYMNICVYIYIYIYICMGCHTGVCANDQHSSAVKRTDSDSRQALTMCVRMLQRGVRCGRILYHTMILDYTIV